MPSRIQRGKMAASAVRLFVPVRSLRSVKSGGHWSESPSHWLFLYVKPSNVALQRYHETYFTSWLSPPPPGGISSRLRGLPRSTLVLSFGITARLGNNPPLHFAKTERSLAGGCKYQPYCCFLCCRCFFDPCWSIKLSFYVSVGNDDRNEGRFPPLDTVHAVLD